MKFSLLFLPVASALVDTPLSPVTRDGSRLLVDGQPWKAVGPNVYWLGLDENVIPPAGEPFDEPTKASYPNPGRITDVMATVRALGGTMIRAHTLGVSMGNPLSVMPGPAVVNEAAFEAIDWAVYQAGRYGVRLLVPLVDNWDYYHGGKYTFLRWAGYDLTGARDQNNPLVQQFYTNATIVSAFKDYIQTLLTHTNRYNDLTYAEDPAIFAYETGNELGGPAGADCPADWIRDIAQFVRSLAPQKLLVDGTSGVKAAHFEVDEVDVFSDHFYPVSLTKLRSDLQLVASSGRAYFAGEYDWTGSSGDPLDEFYEVIEGSSVACGDTFWSLFSRNLPDCSTFVNHTDGFTMQYGNPNDPSTVSRIQLVRQHFLAMNGEQIGPNETLPEVPCPAPTLR